MIFAWNRRRASDATARKRCANVAGLALAALALAAPGAVRPAVAWPGPFVVLPPLPADANARAVAEVVASRRPAVLVTTSPASPQAREQAWLRADRAWLAGAGALLPPDFATDDADALRPLLWAAVAAGGDTLAPVRTRAAALRDRWLARGHLGADVQARGDTLVLAAGPAWTMTAWEVGGDAFPGRERVLADWLPAPGARFDAEAVDASVRGILAAVGEAGYPYPRWVVSDLRLSATSRSVTIVGTLLPGPRAVIGPVTSSLPDPRAARFAVRASGLTRGAPVRDSDLRRAVDRLWARDLYAAVDTPRVHTTTAADTVGVHLPLELRPRLNRLQVVLGLSRRDATQPARASGEVDLRLPNLASSGRALRVGWRDDGAGQSRFGFSWLEPLAFGTPLDASLAIDSEVQEASHTRFTTEIGARLPVVALWGAELGFGRDRSTYPDGGIARSDRSRARVALTHRRGDRARSGWEGSFAVESAWRSARARDGVVGAAELAAVVRQRLLAADVAAEAWLGRRTSVAARAAVRQLTGDEREAPLAEHFRFGGANSVRGHAEGAFHGVEAAWAGLELRLGAARGSRLYTFWDVGYFEFWSVAAADDVAVPAPTARRGWPHGYGLGLLARTPGGDISLAIGFPGTVDFDQAKLHVTLLETF